MAATIENTPKSKRELEKTIKIVILRKLHERRAALWPKSSSSTTGANRQATWEIIRQELIDENVGGFVNRDWRYLRDVTWKNWQSRFMPKIDLIRQNEGIRTEEDELMLSIIDEENSKVHPPICPIEPQILPSTSTVQIPSTSEKRPQKRSRFVVLEEKIAEQKLRKLMLENRLLELQVQEKEAQLMIAQSNFNFPNTDFLNEEDSNPSGCKNEPFD